MHVTCKGLVNLEFEYSLPEMVGNEGNKFCSEKIYARRIGTKV